jgi:Uma2 family endonuclease
MSNAIKILPHYTYKDYVLWEGKWEVIDGVPYAMSPSPIHHHQVLAGNLHSEFRFQLKKCTKCQVSQPVDYLVEDDTILQPDMLITCKPVTNKYLDFPPVLVAEVLSPSTALKDRHSKYSIYESQGIRYYIIIDPDKNEAEVYELTDGKYQLMKQGKDFNFSFDLDECRADIAFREIW